MSKKVMAICMCIMLIAGIISGCGQQEKGKKESEKKNLVITTSFYPMYIATVNVTKGIEGLTVNNLTKPQTGCLHDYQLTTEDMKKLEKTDVFVVNGAGMEAFLDKVIKQQKNLQLVEASKNIKLIKDSEGENPHVWLSISKEIEQVNNITAGLSKADPKNADKYKANASAYIAKLMKLKEEAGKELGNLSSREIVTFHEAFPYFAEEFNLKIAAVIEREPGTEPTPKELEDTIVKIKAMPVKVLFTEPQYPVAAAQTIAKETGAKIFTLDPVVTGEAKPEAADAYLEQMRKNIKTIKEALK